MTNQTLINNTIALCHEVDSLLTDLLDVCIQTPLDIPAYEDIKKDEMVHYTKYADIIEFNNDLSLGVLRGTKMLIVLKDSIGKIAKDKTIPMKLAKEYIDKLNRELLPISEKLKAVKEFKLTLEYHIKFYQNASFLLTSTSNKMF